MFQVASQFKDAKHSDGPQWPMLYEASSVPWPHLQCTQGLLQVSSIVYDLLMSIKLALQSYDHVDLYSPFTTATVQRYLSGQISVISLSSNDPPAAIDRTSGKWATPGHGPTVIPHASRDPLRSVSGRGRSGPPGGLLRWTLEKLRHRQQTRPFRFPSGQSARNGIYRAIQLLPMRLPLSFLTKRITPSKRD
jgi:hypothetical protein